MTVTRLPGSSNRGSVPAIERQKEIAAAGDGTLEPVIQSALGIVRESAGLLYHVAGFGIALIAGPDPSRPKPVIRPTPSATPKPANVIPFPQRETSGRRPSHNRNKS